MKIPIFNLAGEKIGERSKNFKVKSRLNLKQYIVDSLANRRQATAHAKTRGEVAHSTRKPWRQKGTGRARAGSASSPLWKGGGATFPPTLNRHFKKKINRKVRRLARQLLLIDKINSGDALILQKFSLEQPSTRSVAKMIAALDLEGKKVLVVSAKKITNFYLSSRNIKNTSYKSLANLSGLDVALSQKVIISAPALEKIFKNVNAK